MDRRMSARFSSMAAMACIRVGMMLANSLGLGLGFWQQSSEAEVPIDYSVIIICRNSISNLTPIAFNQLLPTWPCLLLFIMGSRCCQMFDYNMSIRLSLLLGLAVAINAISLTVSSVK